MNLELVIIITLTILSTVLVLSVIGLRQQSAAAISDRNEAINTCNLALEAAERADREVAEIRNIHQELLKRPYQVIMSEGACLQMAQEILQYIGRSGDSIDIPIRKGPQQ